MSAGQPVSCFLLRCCMHWLHFTVSLPAWKALCHTAKKQGTDAFALYATLQGALPLDGLLNSVEMAARNLRSNIKSTLAQVQKEVPHNMLHPGSSSTGRGYARMDSMEDRRPMLHACDEHEEEEEGHR